MCARDHPREYGENVLLKEGIAGGAGSSPRIRGEFSEGWLLRGACGIIPANTGRMTFPVQALRPNPDHPREYGENNQFCQGGAYDVGSSPRIRGEFPNRKSRQSPLRIIPANTGRICAAVLTVCAAGDHPREYGENIEINHTRFRWVGSSPRIRGEYDGDDKMAMYYRIIPANTGRITHP